MIFIVLHAHVGGTRGARAKEAETVAAPPIDITAYADAIRAYLDTLPPTVPFGHFDGGIVVKINDDHIVGICVPPLLKTHLNLVGYVQSLAHVSTWEVQQTEYLAGAHEHQLEASHICRAAADAPPAASVVHHTADDFFGVSELNQSAPSVKLHV